MTRSIFDEFFNKSLTNSPFFMDNSKFPKTNIWRLDNKQIIIELAIPYRSKDEIDIQIDNKKRIITIQADPFEISGKREQQIKEIPTSAFCRQFAISQSYNLEPSEVKLKNGILSLIFDPSKDGEDKNRFKTLNIS